MKTRTLALALALAAGTALLAAAPAFAHDPHGRPAHAWRAKPHHPHYYRAPAYVYVPARPVVVVPPPAVVYAPPAAVYAPPAAVYAPPAPVIYGHVPVAPGVRVSFGFRL